MSIELNQVVVITGASSGIGEATARMLAKDGAKIVAVARRKSRLEQLVKDIEAAGGQAIAVEADVTAYEDMQRAAQTAKDTFGRLDVWVNNAGVMPLSPVEMNRLDEWNWMVDVNIRAYSTAWPPPSPSCVPRRRPVCQRELGRRPSGLSGRRGLLCDQVRRTGLQ